MVGRSARARRNTSSDSVASGISGLWSFISSATFRRRRDKENKKETSKKAGKRLKGQGYSQLLNDNATTSAGNLDDYLAGTKSIESGRSEFGNSESAGGKSGERSLLSITSLETRFTRRNRCSGDESERTAFNEWKQSETNESNKDMIHTAEYGLSVPNSGTASKLSKFKAAREFLRRISFQMRNRKAAASKPSIVLQTSQLSLQDSNLSSDKGNETFTTTGSDQQNDHDGSASSLTIYAENDDLSATESTHEYNEITFESSASSHNRAWSEAHLPGCEADSIGCSSYTPMLNLNRVPIPEMTVSTETDQPSMPERRRNIKRNNSNQAFMLARPVPSTEQRNNQSVDEYPIERPSRMSNLAVRFGPIPCQTESSASDDCPILKQDQESLLGQRDAAIQLLASIDRTLKRYDRKRRKSSKYQHQGGSRTKESKKQPHCSSSQGNLEGKQETPIKRRPIMKAENLAWTIASPRPRKGTYTGITLYGRVPHGFGTLEFTNGDVYAGPFKGGEMHGDNALYVSECGNVYKGSFERNLKHGHGAETMSNHRRYVGRYEYGLRHGFGILFDANGSVLHVGLWHVGAFVERENGMKIYVDDDSVSSSSSNVSAISMVSSAGSFSMYADVIPRSQDSEKHVPIAMDIPKSSDAHSLQESTQHHDEPMVSDASNCIDATLSEKPKQGNVVAIHEPISTN
jgi:hypothetical protein